MREGMGNALAAFSDVSLKSKLSVISYNVDQQCTIKSNIIFVCLVAGALDITE